MELKTPFFISARLAPAIKVGNATISLIETTEGNECRTRCIFAIDTSEFEYIDRSLQTGCGSYGTQVVFASFLSFLSAAGESYSHTMRTGKESENASLFPANITEWAYQNSDEIDILAAELEENKGLITE